MEILAAAALIVVLITKAAAVPAEMSWKPPLDTVAPLTVPPATACVPLSKIVVPRSVPPPLTVSVPPPLMVVTLAVPPEDTTSKPPLETVVASAVPPEETISTLSCGKPLVLVPVPTSRAEMVSPPLSTWIEPPLTALTL